MENQLKERRLPVVWLGAALVIVVAVILLYLAFGRVERIPGLLLYQDVGRGHASDVTFADTGLPPAGGRHLDTWLNCGVYAEPVETGQAVHSLEHGAVWITYRPDLSADQVEALRERVREAEYLILSPYPGQGSPIVLTAWAVQLEVDGTDDPRLDDFIVQYQQGPTAPELGAACSNGAGEPLF